MGSRTSSSLALILKAGAMLLAFVLVTSGALAQDRRCDFPSERRGPNDVDLQETEATGTPETDAKSGAADDDADADAETEPKAQATLFPIPDYRGDFFTRPAATGDWGGLRTDLAKKGFQFSLDINQYSAGVVRGGIDEEWENNGSTDFRVKFDSGQAGYWPGGFVEMHAESYWGTSTLAYSGSILPSNMDDAMSQPAAQGTYLSHVTLTQFLSERLAFTGGKIDTSTGDPNEYAHGVGTENFMNAAFNLNPVTYLTSPYSTLGGGFIYLLGENKQHMAAAMVYDGDGRIDTAGFDTIDDDRTSFAATIRLETNLLGKKGHQFAGFIYGNGRYDPQTQDPRIFLPVTPNVDFESEDSTWCFFYNFDQQLITNPDNPDEHWGLFGRFGAADKDTSVIESFTSVGFGGTGLIPGREQDRFGVGYYFMQFNEDRIKQILRQDDEHGAEAFYKFAVTPWFELTADVQFIGGALVGADNAVITSLRGQISF